MGQKLNIDLDDSLYDILNERPVGISGGCYCCSKQVHIKNTLIDMLPAARINDKDLYNVLMCDLCNDDVKILQSEGVGIVSFDILFLIQSDLTERIYNYTKKNKKYNDEARTKILVDLYNEYLERMNGDDV